MLRIKALGLCVCAFYTSAHLLYDDPCLKNLEKLHLGFLTVMH